MTSTNRTVRLKVSPGVARIAGPGAPRDARLQAARGALPLAPAEQVAALFFLAHGQDAVIRAEALKTLQRLEPSLLTPVAADPELDTRLLDFMARVRLRNPEVMAALLENPAFPEATLLKVAAHARDAVLELFRGLIERRENSSGVKEKLVAALRSNPHLTEGLRAQMDQVAAESENGDGSVRETGEADAEGSSEQVQPHGDAAAEEVEEAEEENLSKYQLALEMGVSEKIKMALTGDKEWRGLFLKDSNKLVSAAVLKNPRITDGEVLAVAKNKSTSEELIRLITLNREWVKNNEIKRALIYHPKTPLPKALRYMGIMTEKDLKQLSKSRGVSQVLVNNARRMLTAKQSSR